MADEQPPSDGHESDRTPHDLGYASPGSNANLSRNIADRFAAWIRRITLVEWAIVLLIVAVVLFVVLPIIDTREGSPRVQCLANLRQLGAALHMYVRANGGVYPAGLVDVCSPAVPPAYFVCPASKTETPARAGATTRQSVASILAAKNHVTYVYVVAGAKASSLRPNAVIAYEPVPNHGPGTRARANVLFADGHAASLPASVFATMVQELNSGQNPPPAAAGQ